MATFSICLPGSVCCSEPELRAIEAGDTLRLRIDETKFPNAPKTEIDALVNSLTPSKVWSDDDLMEVDGFCYNVTVADEDMPTVNQSKLTELDVCDLWGWSCKSCCDELQDQLDGLQQNPYAVTYWLKGPVEPDSTPNLGAITPMENDTVAQYTTTGCVEYWTYRPNVDLDLEWQKDFEHCLPSKQCTEVVTDVILRPSPNDVGCFDIVVTKKQICYYGDPPGSPVETTTTYCQDPGAPYTSASENDFNEEVILPSF